MILYNPKATKNRYLKSYEMYPDDWYSFEYCYNESEALEITKKQYENIKNLISKNFIKIEVDKL